MKLNKKLIKKTSGKKAHADFGASGSKRWLSCPGSIRESKGMPNNESKSAAEGTDAHACLEFLLKNRKNLSAAKKMALAKWSAEMVEHALESVAHILDLIDHKTTEVFIELEVDSSKFTTDGQFSTLDVAVAQHHTRTLHILDYKYGAGILVEVEDNTQLIYYALATLLRLGHKKFDHVFLHVLQPRAFHPTGETIRFHKMHVSELMVWGKKFKKGVNAALKPDAPLNAGEWCRFCPARIKCPVIREQSFKEASIDFSPIKDEIKNIPAVRDIKDIGKLLAACEKLEVFITAVRERAFNDAKRGLKVNGYKLVEQRSNRQWNNPDKAIKAAVKALGESALVPPKLLSPAQFEKKFKKKKGAMKWLSENTSKKTGGVTLAKITDKRKSTSIIDASFTIIKEE